MKRLIALCLCLLMLPVMALASSEREREASLWERVDGLLQAQAGYASDAYHHGEIVGDPNNGWTFSIVLYDHPEDEDGVIVYFLTSGGELIHQRGPEKISLGIQAQNALGECFGPDCYLKVAQTALEWRDRLALLDTPSAEDINHPWAEHVLALDIRFPEEGAVPYEEAIVAANTVLLSLPGWTEETLTHYEVNFSAYMVPEDIGRPVWLFYYDKVIPSRAAYKSEDAWTKAMVAAYERTILGKEEPLHFSVLIDAADGSLVEAPKFDYRAPEFLWSDFIVRPSKFLAYYAEND